MELFSGLLLTVVVLAILAYVARELIADDAGGGIGKYLGDSPPADAPMLGKHGTVRGQHRRTCYACAIEGERWRANPVAGAILPAGTPVRVTAVNGLVLEVEPIAVEGDVEEKPATRDSVVSTE